MKKSRIANLFARFLGLALFVLLIWGGIKLISFLFHALGRIDTRVAVAIVAASATVIASTVTIVLGRYFEAKRDREAAHRDKKIGLYDEFLKKLFEIFGGGGEDKGPKEDLVPFLRDINRKLTLWSGPQVIKAYAEWHEVLTSQRHEPKAKSMIKMIDFFLALRKDLGHSNKGIKRDYLVRFLLQNPELFMQMYRENPEVTFWEIATAEEKLKKEKRTKRSSGQLNSRR